MVSSEDLAQIQATVKEALGLQQVERLAYTVEDASTAVGLATHVIRDAISRGELQARKRGRYWMIRKDYLLKWLAARD